MSDGLDDVVAAQTVLSDVDGAAGRLVIRGLPLEAIAGRMSYEDVLALLWDGFFPDLPDDLRSALGKARMEVFAALGGHLTTMKDIPATDGLRALMAMLPDGADLDTALRLTAAPAVLLPALIRQEAGLAPLAPEAGTEHAADMQRMLTGKADDAKAAGLAAYLVTVADHGLNASTFAARVVASTQAGLTSSTIAAFGALKGPLHGGAPGPVLDMLDAVAVAGNAPSWIEAQLAAGHRLMGFGHRIYRVRDPRADALKTALGRLSKAGAVDPERFAFAGRVEAEALAALKRHKPGRPLETNVEFYTALLLEALGFPRETFTAVFAAGRIGGWIAHAREQAATGRLIRPKSLYVGPQPLQAA